MNASIYLGYPMYRWLTSIAIMTEKENNNSQMNRLRIINLYEVDYNLILKYFWPLKATSLAKRKNTLGINTWSARPNRNIHNATLFYEFITEIRRLSFPSMCKFQDDAVACYDWIISSNAMLCSREYEVSNSFCILTTKNLYSLKTIFRQQNILQTNSIGQ